MVKTRGDLYVVTGALFQGELQQIGGAVMVPSAMYKAVYDPQRVEGGAYVVENVAGVVPQVVSLAEVEKMAGVRLFPSLGDSSNVKAMRLSLPRSKR